MNEEPIEVRLARMVLAADLDYNDDAVQLRREAGAIVNAYEANLARVLKQDEEKQRRIKETTERWPELAAEGYWYEETEYYCTMHRQGHNTVELSKDNEDNELTIEGYSDDGGGLSANSAVVLALIDAAGQNTTANKLRAAIDAALDTKGISSNVALVLQRALEQ